MMFYERIYVCAADLGLFSFSFKLDPFNPNPGAKYFIPIIIPITVQTT